MDFLSAVGYGILQGAAEFLPISSSGHLALAQHFFGAEDMETGYFSFNILLHLSTLLVVVGVYIKDVLKIIRAFFALSIDVIKGRGMGLGDPWRRMAIMIIVSVFPLFLILPIKDEIEGLSGSPVIVGCFLIVTGFMLMWADRMSGQERRGRTLARANLKDGLTVGLFQALGTLPGISRSGATISGGLFRGLERPLAVKFSFLISIPAVVGANILHIKDMEAVPAGQIPVYMAAMAAAAISGFFAIRLINYLAIKGNFRIFSVYCLAVGSVSIIAAMAGF